MRVYSVDPRFGGVPTTEGEWNLETAVRALTEAVQENTRALQMQAVREFVSQPSGARDPSEAAQAEPAWPQVIGREEAHDRLFEWSDAFPHQSAQRNVLRQAAELLRYDERHWPVAGTPFTSQGRSK